MIKLATVFSGIGAIEHALSRMELDKEIIFACDNGEIDVLSKQIDLDMDQIEEELSSLRLLINNIEFSNDDGYETQLLDMLSAAEDEYKKIKSSLDGVTIDNYNENVSDILNKILNTNDLKENRVKVFTEFNDNLNSNFSSTQTKLYLYRVILKLTNDFKRDNSLADLGQTDVEFASSVNINWAEISKSLKIVYDIYEAENGGKFIRSVRNLSQRIGQLHGKINSLGHLNKIKQLNYDDKKKYVDNLYNGKDKQNKVKMSYMANYDCDDDHFHWDASFLDGTQYKNQVDLFVGGSPCQSFSIVGKERGLSDTRGTV